MELFDKKVRKPNNLDKDIELETYYSINNALDKIYGLSIFSRGATEWKSYIGTLSFLYGIWVNLKHSNEVHDKMNDRLISKLDLDDDFHGAIFFNLNHDNQPTNIIKSFRIIRDIGLNFLFKSDNEKYVIINTSYLYDQYDNTDEDETYNRLPKLIFQIK